RTPFWERTAKWVRRHPTTATLIGLSTAAVLALLIAYQRYDAYNKRKAWERQQQAEHQLAQSEVDLEKAQSFLDAKRWNDSRATLNTVIGELGTDTRYATLKARASRMREKAVRGLQDEADQNHEREQQRRFIEHRDQAFLRESRYTGLDLPSDVQTTRTA